MTVPCPPSPQLLSRGELPAPYAAGLAATHWPGRAQVVRDTDSAAPVAERCGNLTFYLDGAHTGESTATCAQWFADAAVADENTQAAPSQRVLVFNCMKARRGAARRGAACAVGEHVRQEV